MKLKTTKLLLLFSLLNVLVISCSKDGESPEPVEEVIEEVEVLLPTCVDYSVADEDDLFSYWDLFVNDVICSRGGPDYGSLNTSVNLSFEVQTEEQFASGNGGPDHAGYSTFAGYCNPERVFISVTRDYWEDYTELQKLWLMYHEFGHDVYRYEHSTNPDDIMWPSVTRSDLTMNDFIEAKNRMFRRDFDGIKYISCPD